MRNIESFSSEQALLSRIDNLKSQGVAERDMHVISKNKLEGSALDYTDVQFKNADGSFGDKVASLFTGEDPQHRVFEKLNLSDAEQSQYVREVESGNILLYVDNDATYNTSSTNNAYDSTSTASHRNSTNGVAGGYVSQETLSTGNTGRTLNEKSYDHPDDGTTGLSGRSSYESDTDAQYSSHHRESNLNNREERVDMRNEFNNTNDFDRVDNDRLDNNLVGGRDGVNNDRRNYEFDEDIKNRTDLSDDEKIRLHEERIRVGKDQVQTGEVRIDKDVVEERQEFDVPVSRDEVTIERRRVDEKVEGDMDFDRLDNDTIRVPLTEERINVEKENVVAEELVIKKNRVQDTAHVSETVRKEEVNIDDTNNRHVDNDRLGNDRLDGDRFDNDLDRR
ncbi:YsnF/AvaK domain-containing protein [Macrococcus lamae]|uniref:YsnF/AvaK domain-containing protein n=1 Tax=Macrococcus lamae TaxID=198484 RepID=A0A4R6BTL9_9STAP|nr:YsnF/AvaK domain-containing protein [Macrococcus lamae]TDM10442.1 YsnF/AvaK domain-containing protein [Macrococcus lamae]